MFTLAISCLATSNLPWFMDLTFQVPMQYCSLHIGPCFCHQSIHNWVLFLLWLHPFIPSGVISPLISSSILGTYWPGEFVFQCTVFLPQFLPGFDSFLFLPVFNQSHYHYWEGYLPWNTKLRQLEPEFERVLGVGDGQGSLVCCSSWGHKESNMTERLNWTEKVLDSFYGFLTWKKR